MRHWPNLRAGKFKQPDPNTGVVYTDSPDGCYLIGALRVIASNGEGWEHVSVSRRDRAPTWEEMESIRELFWRDDETVMWLSVPRRQHINCHRNCLHMWRPLNVDIPLPPARLV